MLLISIACGYTLLGAASFKYRISGWSREIVAHVVTEHDAVGDIVRRVDQVSPGVDRMMATIGAALWPAGLPLLWRIVRGVRRCEAA